MLHTTVKYKNAFESYGIYIFKSFVSLFRKKFNS